MRVISGSLKGKKIEGFDLKGTRPTMDRIKESIFNIINPYLKGAIVLDLFSGSGNLGIEAYSRGAKKVYLNDINKDAIKVINTNIEGYEGFIVSNEDYMSFLSEFKKQNTLFDLVFLDPPYEMNVINEVLLFLNDNLLSENGIVVCEYENIEEIDYSNLELLKEKKYGYKKIKIFRRKK